MVILRPKSKNTQRAARVTISLRAVGVTKQSCDGEFSSLDPKRGGLLDALERGLNDYTATRITQRTLAPLPQATHSHLLI